MGAIDGQPIQARGHTFWPCLGTTWEISGSLGAPVRVVLLSHAVSCVWTTHHLWSSGIPHQADRIKLVQPYPTPVTSKGST